jgi:hypothetical protein
MTATLRHLMLALLLGAAALAAWSIPTMYGDTGLVLVPSADVAKELRVDAAFGAVRMSSTNGESYAFPIRVNYGATGNLELSGVFSESHGPAPGAENVQIMGGGAKFSIHQERFGRQSPGVAMGARYLRMERGEWGSTDVIEGYGVVSKVLYQTGDMLDSGYAIRAHAGAYYRYYKMPTTNASAIAPFAGLTYRNFTGMSVAADFIPQESLMLKADNYDTTLHPANDPPHKYAFSLMFRQPLSDNFTAEVGLTRPFAITKDNSFYIGLNYHYGEVYAVGEKRRPELF